MKKTLVLTHEYFPFHGGIGRYCYNLFKRLPQDKYVVVTDQRVMDRDVPAVRSQLLFPRLKPSWLRGFFTVRSLVKKHRAAIIFTPQVLPLGTMAFVLRKITGTPYVISLHGMDINLAIQNNRRLTRAILTSARHIVANSESTARTVQSLRIPTRVSVITPSVDEGKLVVDPHVREALNRKYHGKQIILTIGRLVRRKGQDTVIKALPRIVQKVPEVQYVIVGDGPDRRYLSELCAAHGMSAHVDILTDVADDALGAYYASASAFVMPTRAMGPDAEGFGIAYLEAAYFSLPIIAGNSGGEREAVGDDSCGIFVNGSDVNEVAAAVIQVLSNRERAHSLGAHAKQRLASLPNWDTQAHALEKILS